MIPLLKLSEAALGVKTMQTLRGFKSTDCGAVSWTDLMMVVLHYMHHVRNLFCSFIANRLTTVRTGTKVEYWRHIRSDNSSSDQCYRWMMNLIPSETWIDTTVNSSLPESRWFWVISAGNQNKARKSRLP